MLADALPIYPLYALLFADAGLSDGQISGLFAVWSATAVVAEVPTGALADRFSRRWALVVSGLMQGAGFAMWIARPSLPGFAVGFVLGGVGGSCASGAFEALLYDGLAAAGSAGDYPRVSGRVEAAGLLGQMCAAGAAIVLFGVGGFALAGWVSVGLCVASAALALRLPEAARATGAGEHFGYVAGLRVGVLEATTHPAVRLAVAFVAVVTGLDALEEYFPLLARDWGIRTALNPAAMLLITLVGAAGALLAGHTGLARVRTLGLTLGAAGVLLGAAAVADRPIGLVPIAAFFGAHQWVIVLLDANLQRQITGPARATVTSVAALLTEVSVFAVYAAWTLGGAVSCAVFVCAAGFLLMLSR